MDIIVVEGYHDLAKIKSIYPNANCIITNGIEISDDTINMLKKLAKENNIIIFTDPDSPGEKIRKIINDNIPNAKHAFLRNYECKSKNNKKVGIEHANKEAIINALNNVYESNNNDSINIKDLYELRLIGLDNSKQLRDKISDYLNIGRPNAKTFLKRLNMLNITKEKLSEIICKIK